MTTPTIPTASTNGTARPWSVVLAHETRQTWRELLRVKAERGQIDWRQPIAAAFPEYDAAQRAAITPLALAQIIGMQADPWYGPLHRFMDHAEAEHITDIAINGSGKPVLVKRRGSYEETSLVLHPEWMDYLHLILMMYSGMHERLIATDPTTPDYLMPWPGLHFLGTVRRRFRYSATRHPTAVDGPLVAIRVLPSRWRTIDALIEQGILNRAAAYMLLYALRKEVSVLVAGVTGSGKTTFTGAVIQALADHRPDLRIGIIEQATELPPMPNSFSKEVIPASVIGPHRPPPPTFSDLIAAAMREDPDYVVVGEVRGPEAYAMLKAGSTGHPGIGTIHAPDCQTAIRNLENRANEHPEAVPSAVRAMIANATVPMVVIHIVNHEGHRHVTTIEEVLPSGGDTSSGGRYPTQLLWEWNHDTRKLHKRYAPSGDWARGVVFPTEGEDVLWQLP